MLRVLKHNHKKMFHNAVVRQTGCCTARADILANKNRLICSVLTSLQPAIYVKYSQRYRKCILGHGCKKQIHAVTHTDTDITFHFTVSLKDTYTNIYTTTRLDSSLMSLKVKPKYFIRPAKFPRNHYWWLINLAVMSSGGLMVRELRLG